MKKIFVLFSLIFAPTVSFAANSVCIGDGEGCNGVDKVTLANSTPIFRAVGFVDGSTITSANGLGGGGGSDNMGTHVASKTVNMSDFAITNASHVHTSGGLRSAGAVDMDRTAGGGDSDMNLYNRGGNGNETTTIHFYNFGTSPDKDGTIQAIRNSGDTSEGFEISAVNGAYLELDSDSGTIKFNSRTFQDVGPLFMSSNTMKISGVTSYWSSTMTEGVLHRRADGWIVTGIDDNSGGGTGSASFRIFLSSADASVNGSTINVVSTNGLQGVVNDKTLIIEIPTGATMTVGGLYASSITVAGSGGSVQSNSGALDLKSSQGDAFLVGTASITAVVNSTPYIVTPVDIPLSVFGARVSTGGPSTIGPTVDSSSWTARLNYASNTLVSASWDGIMPDAYLGEQLYLHIVWFTTATAGNVSWNSEMWRQNIGQYSDTPSYGTNVSSVCAAPTTSGRMAETYISINNDGLLRNEVFTIKLDRAVDATAGSPAYVRRARVTNFKP